MICNSFTFYGQRGENYELFVPLKTVQHRSTLGMNIGEPTVKNKQKNAREMLRNAL